MADFFGFEPKNYSDEELLERSVELSRRMLWASRMGSQAIVGQLQAQKMAIEMEQRERMFQNGYGAHVLASHSVVVETDPDLAAVLKTQREEEAAKSAPQPRSRPKPLAIQKERRDRVRPTNAPTQDEE